MNSEQKRLIRVQTSAAKTAAHFGGTKALRHKQFELQFYVSDILYITEAALSKLRFCRFKSYGLIWPLVNVKKAN